MTSTFESRTIGVASRVGTVETVMNNHTGRGKGVRPVEAPKTPGKVCWQCGGAHLRRQCPQLSRTSDRSSGRGAGPPHGPGRTVQVSQAVISTAAAELAVDCEPQVQATQCVVAGSVSRGWAAQGMGLDGGRHAAEFEDGIVEAGRESTGKFQLAREVAAEAVGASPDVAAQEVRVDGESMQSSKAESAVMLDGVEALNYVDIILDERPDRVLRSLNDSGSQLTIIKRNILDGYDYPLCGSVKIRRLFGSPTNADLTYLTVKLADNPKCAVRVLCAVCEGICEDVILPAAVVSRLNDQFNDYLARESPYNDYSEQSAMVAEVTSEGACTSGQPEDLPSNVNSSESGDVVDAFLDVDSVSDAVIDPGVATVVTLQREQLADKSLTGCWRLAKQGKGNFLVKEGLLFCREKLCGQSTECLMVPEGRRKYVFDTAHAVTGGHFNYRKTRDRIKMSGLTWCTLTRDCKQWSQKCDVCQKMARTTCYDRIPIQAVHRSTSLFAHFFCDVFGPILPDQKVRYNYCLVLVDSYSLWVSAYPLCNLMAKSICLALLNMFSYTGLSSEVTVMSTDNASYFRAELTREFLKRIGVSPRFHTPMLHGRQG
jgi:hypothetical protein